MNTQTTHKTRRPAPLAYLAILLDKMARLDDWLWRIEYRLIRKWVGEECEQRTTLAIEAGKINDPLERIEATLLHALANDPPRTRRAVLLGLDRMKARLAAHEAHCKPEIPTGWAP